MTTKQELLAQADSELNNPLNTQYSKISALNQAQDPFVVAQIGAMAQMLELYSTQQDLAETEVFVKARDATILADATLKGILPLANSASVSVQVTNASSSAITLAYGRRLLDDKGRVWRVASTLVVPPKVGLINGVGTVALTQNELRTITHTIANSDPFYTITLPNNDEGLYLENIRIKDTIGNTDNLYRYAPEFMNVLNGERVYHLETDEARQITIRLGANDGASLIYGFQPPVSTVLTIELTETLGKLDIATGGSFSLEYSNNSNEDLLKFVSVAIGALGNNPLSLQTLSVLSKYSAIYDHNAVYLSDFDFLLRRYHGDRVNFLAVWNEQIEEKARTYSVNNINKLFVAVQAKNALEQASLEADIFTLLQRADNSYRYDINLTYPVIDLPYPLTITASVAAIHDNAQVTQQIKDTLLAIYGKGQLKVSQGLKTNFNRQEIYSTLKKSIPAFQDSISDFSVTVGTLPDPILPEHYFYLHPTINFTVTVTQLSDAGGGLWN